MSVCLNCKKTFIKKESVQKFCDKSCSATYNNKRRVRKLRFCVSCGEVLYKKSQKKYCSTKCQADHYYNDYITRWKSGLEHGLSGYGVSAHIKRYLLKKYCNKCSQCGWSEVSPHTGNIPLETEHHDGDWKNNREENLCLLCPNCHSLTKTYKGANKGNGRKARKKYYLPSRPA